MNAEPFDGMTIFWKLLAVALLVLMNAFFVAAELALVKVRETQLDPLLAKGQRHARMARRLIMNLDGVLSVTQLGITIGSLGLGYLVEPVFHALLAPVFSALKVESETIRTAAAILVGFLVNGYALIVVGELVPKALAIRQTVAVAVWTAYPLVWFRTMTYPFVWLLNHSAQWLLGTLGLNPRDGEAPGHSTHGHSEEELRLLLTVSQSRSGVSAFSHDLVLNALDLRRRIVRQVMRPRQEITALSTTASLAECLDLAEKTRYSRFPLCAAGDLDQTLGVVHIKDLFAMRLKARSGADLQGVTRKIIYVPETARLEQLLRRFLDRKLHLAVVVDEYGGTVGLVTLENILEEVVGQIQDEFDQEKPLIQKVGEQTWEVDGAWPLHELGEFVGQDLAAEGITTTSGWVTHRLGGFAKAGDQVRVGDFELRVEEMDGLRVARLTMCRLAAAMPADAPPA